MALQNAFNAVKSKAYSVAENFVPVLKESKFKETGVITPEEFVAAGDYLVHHCPTWHWARGEESKIKPFLPPDKQYLETKNVPCHKRCSDIEQVKDIETIWEEGNDGGWMNIQNETSSEFKNDATEDEEMKTDKATAPAASNDDDDEEDDDEDAMDMEAFEEAGMLESDAATLTTTSGGAQDILQEASATKDGILPTRTYDLNITYDKFYQTPRLWLFGYDETRKPLTIEEMYADISQDHVNKTVTMEPHTHLPPPPMASIHPCRHAEVMKKILQTVQDGGGEVEVHQYLLIFLKFVQAVIPTIEYDYTRHISM